MDLYRSCRGHGSRLVVAMCALLAVPANGRNTSGPATSIPLDSLKGLEMVRAKGEIVEYRGRRSLHLLPAAPPQSSNETTMALVEGLDFQDGTIQLDVAGKPGPGSPPDDRGYIGIVFRAQDHGARAESIFLRQTNGRADDQLRRNHSAQYESLPDFRWYTSRKEAPGVYESYCDQVAGEWTNMKIEVAGSKARLYVNHAEQPCLIVNELKLGAGRGAIGLYAYSTSDVHYSRLKVEKKD